MFTKLRLRALFFMAWSGTAALVGLAHGQDPLSGGASPAVHAAPADYGNYSEVMPGECCDTCASWFGGAEYRYMQAHFSEGLGYARMTGAPPITTQVTIRELDFDYDSTFKVFFGRHLADNADLQFSYWYFDTETRPGEVVGPGVVSITDPFGNTATPGQSIQTSASVNLNVFDIEYFKPIYFDHEGLDLRFGAGVRFADISQFYDSNISDAAGTLLTAGVFNVDYFGVGPNLSLAGTVRPAFAPRTSFFAKGSGAILVGQYDIGGGVSVPAMGVTASQFADRTRAVPVIESELGMSWEPMSGAILSAGWNFQSWWNMGASGGGFGGVFTAADDSDIMSFDGMFLRAELHY